MLGSMSADMRRAVSDGDRRKELYRRRDVRSEPVQAGESGTRCDCAEKAVQQLLGFFQYSLRVHK